MSLIAAVKNSKDIVICWDSLSTVITVNSQLACMLTGTYDDTHITSVKELVEKIKNVHELDEAFKDVYQLGNDAKLMEGQEFQVALAGYIEGAPTFRFVMRAYGTSGIQYNNDYPINFFLSGDGESVVAAEKAVRREGLTAGGIPTRDIQQELTGIVDTCIKEHPKTLGSPTSTLILTPAS